LLLVLVSTMILVFESHGNHGLVLLSDGFRSLQTPSSTVHILKLGIQPQSESYITTEGQSTNLSCNKAPVWGLRTDFYYCEAVAGLLMWGVLSDERKSLTLTIAPGPLQRRHFQVQVPWDSWPYFTVSDSRLPFSPPTTCRITVEIFEPASTRESPLGIHEQTGRLTVRRNITFTLTWPTLLSIVQWQRMHRVHSDLGAVTARICLCWNYGATNVTLT
jgi:hypothetical protein